jgi:hypothetical protein
MSIQNNYRIGGFKQKQANSLQSVAIFQFKNCASARILKIAGNNIHYSP